MFFFFKAEDGIRDLMVTGVQTCALPISKRRYWGVERTGCAALAGARGAARTLHAPVPPLRARPRRKSPLPRCAPCEIGRAAGRERVEIRGVAVSIKKKKTKREASTELRA